MCLFSEIPTLVGLSTPSVKDERVTVPSVAYSSQIIIPSSAVSENPIWLRTNLIFENAPEGENQVI